MKTHNILVLILVLFTCMTCCKKQPKTEPEPEEYFNCYIDGEYFTYTKEYSWVTNKALKCRLNHQGWFEIMGFDAQNAEQNGIGFFIVGGGLPTKDTLDLKAYQRAELYYRKLGTPSSSANTNDSIGGQLIFTTRTTSLVKGIFNFDVLNPNNNQIVHITNGKFKVIPE
jgi:hypothetical protein